MMNTGQKLIREIRKLAAEHPERKARCVYYSKVDQSPCCIVGTAADSLGLISFDLIAGSSNYSAGTNKMGWGLVWPAVAGRKVISPDDMNWIRRVQVRQDEHDTWAQAVAEADRVHGSRW